MPILKPINWDILLDMSDVEKAKYKVWVITDACPAGVGTVLAQGEDWRTSRPAAFMLKKFTLTQCSYFGYELEALAVLEALTKWLDELTGRCKFTVVTDHKVLTYFKAKQHSSGCHIHWQNFFSRFNCDVVYIEGHKNKVADALLQYYKSSSNEDLHYDDFVSADIKIDKNGEDLPLHHAEEAQELLFLNHIQWYTGFTPTSVLDVKEQCQLDAEVIDPPIEGIGRSMLTLTDLVGLTVPPIEDIRLLTSIKFGYSNSPTWTDVLKMPEHFPKFNILDGLILFVNDSGDPSLVIPEAIHKGEGLKGILIENAHRIIGHFGYNKTLVYMQKLYWWLSGRIQDQEHM